MKTQQYLDWVRQQSQEYADSGVKCTPSVCNPYPLRPDFLAQVVIPRDMTTDEAERLCEFIRALAQPAR